MTAASPVLLALLEVQAHDTAIDQLRHRKASLSEKTELADVRSRRAQLQAARDEVGGRRDEIATRQDKAEADIAVAERRIGEIDTRMRSGQVSASRDLQAMEHEIATIRERVSALEDAGLEAMEECEPLDVEVDGFDSQIESLTADETRLLASIAAEEAEIDSSAADTRDARAAVAANVPDDLLKRYEDLRSRLAGVGAAKLDGHRCSGCHLTLPPTEIDRLKREPPDALVYCEQCGRILVRVD